MGRPSSSCLDSKGNTFEDVEPPLKKVAPSTTSGVKGEMAKAEPEAEASTGSEGVSHPAAASGATQTGEVKATEEKPPAPWKHPGGRKIRHSIS